MAALQKYGCRLCQNSGFCNVYQTRDLLLNIDEFLLNSDHCLANIGRCLDRSLLSKRCLVKIDRCLAKVDGLPFLIDFDRCLLIIDRCLVKVVGLIKITKNLSFDTNGIWGVHLPPLPPPPPLNPPLYYLSENALVSRSQTSCECLATRLETLYDTVLWLAVV